MQCGRWVAKRAFIAGLRSGIVLGDYLRFSDSPIDTVGLDRAAMPTRRMGLIVRPAGRVAGYRNTGMNRARWRRLAVHEQSLESIGAEQPLDGQSLYDDGEGNHPIGHLQNQCLFRAGR